MNRQQSATREPSVSWPCGAGLGGPWSPQAPESPDEKAFLARLARHLHGPKAPSVARQEEKWSERLSTWLVQREQRGSAGCWEPQGLGKTEGTHPTTGGHEGAGLTQ